MKTNTAPARNADDNVEKSWCKRSTRELQDRVDSLISLTVAGKATQAEQAEAVALAQMILRRS